MFASCYDDPTKGHARICRTKELINRQYWWKYMGKDIEDCV